MNKKLIALFAFSVASVTGAVFAQNLKRDANAGQGKVALSISRHCNKGYYANFPETHKVPKIAAESAKYIFEALAALANYLRTLNSNLETTVQTRFK